ncbi:hypothetical protein [Streptomyces monashensis]|uniref:Lipoprotein n=1 Tax=Streptomyces monashensis TaxID=1678012 RepID=A0A1S2QGF3_9ACTN|nr:hypothetical protein [Streptomyces monashensis]OIK05232.1 hypothetical protein BIV23_13290 [Streptomyces monashensis]
MRPRTTALAVLVLPVLVSGCAPAPVHRLSSDDLIKAATRVLTDDCLSRRGLSAPRPDRSPPSSAEQQRVSDALFGTGPAQLSVRLPTGFVVRAHSDGCLAAAQQRLYGDQRRWFRASTIVDNLGPEATHARLPLATVRERHSADLADWRRMRSRAVTAAVALLRVNSPTA